MVLVVVGDEGADDLDPVLGRQVDQTLDIPRGVEVGAHKSRDALALARIRFDAIHKEEAWQLLWIAIDAKAQPVGRVFCVGQRQFEPR